MLFFHHPTSEYPIIFKMGCELSEARVPIPVDSYVEPQYLIIRRKVSLIW
jgi:hypothetical protein